MVGTNVRQVGLRVYRVRLEELIRAGDYGSIPSETFGMLVPFGIDRRDTSKLEIKVCTM